MWSFFGDIRCINLIERNDRYEAASKVFKEYKIPVNFHRVERSPKGGVQGCFESHIQVITDAYERGLETVLIFEDDIEAGYGLKEEKIKEALNFMENNQDWNVVFLGWHPRVRTHKTKHVSGSIYQVSALGGHAYIVSRRMMKKMANKKFEGIPIDEFYAEDEHAYALYPSAFVQSGSDSDLVNNISSSKWSKPYRRVIEWWAINVNYRLDSLLKVLFILVVCIAVDIFIRRKKALKDVTYWILLLVILLVILG